MGLCAIALVTGKAVLRILFIVFQHYPVPGDLGYYRCRGYRYAFGIARDDTPAGAFGLELHIAVNYYIVGLCGEVLYGEMHRPPAGLVYIYQVYRLFVDDADADEGLLEDLPIGALALPAGQPLGIIHPGAKFQVFQYYGAGDDGACERAAARLIDTSYQPETVFI